MSKQVQCLHRVRFFETNLHFLDTAKMDENSIFWAAADEFKNTDRYRWVENNNIKLQWGNDLNTLAWQRQIIFYGDLNEKQFVDYTLRFS